MFEVFKTEILVSFFKFFLNFIILKHWTMLGVSETEIIIIFLIVFKFYNFKTFKL